MKNTARRLPAAAAAIATLKVIPSSAHAQAGRLDRTFGNGGIATNAGAHRSPEELRSALLSTPERTVDY